MFQIQQNVNTMKIFTAAVVLVSCLIQIAASFDDGFIKPLCPFITHLRIDLSCLQLNVEPFAAIFLSESKVDKLYMMCYASNIIIEKGRNLTMFHI